MECDRHENQELKSMCCGVNVVAGSSVRCALCGKVVGFACPKCEDEKVAA